ncbi:MAG: hypothetical protein BYD32DRAFT_412079 [Podila humilis]|nr:MAG: hypothetical protein BYD32DRAFT_412079 [Podila humilis]
MPNDHVEINEALALHDELPQDVGIPPADGLFYPLDVDFDALAPPSPILESNILDLNDLLQHLEMDINSHSPKATTTHPPLALTPAILSHHPWLPSSSENSVTHMAPTAQTRSLYNVLTTCLQQEPVTSAVSDILSWGFQSQPSIHSSLPGPPSHLYPLTPADPPRAYSDVGCYVGPSITSISETGYPSLQHKYTASMALKVEDGFLCPAVGCTTVHKRRDTLKNHFQRAHSVSRERVMCLEPGCRRSFGFLQELKRHRAEFHGNGARYCPCLKRWFTRRGHLVDRCPNRENCSAAIDRRRKTNI